MQLHHILDMTAEDCLEPHLKDVLPDDVRMYGERVMLHGLKGRADLNGAVGRCGQYNASKERYEVFLPLHWQIDPILIKPSNLLIAPKVSAEILSKEIFSHCPYPKRFPRVGMCCQFMMKGNDVRSLDGHVIDKILKAPDWDENSKISQVIDSYSGPVSGAAQVVLRKIGLVEPKGRGDLACIVTAAKFPQRLNSRVKDKAKRTETFVSFLRMIKDRDAPRVNAYEKRISSIADDVVSKKCGAWLKIDVKLDSILPTVQREIVVSPNLTLRELHDQILTSCLGWAANCHAYAFRSVPYLVDFDESSLKTLEEVQQLDQLLEGLRDSVWIGPKVRADAA